MKKITCLITVLILILLTSCSGGGSERTYIHDDPEASLKEALALDSVQNGKVINTVTDKNMAYVEVFVAENASETLFYQTIDLDDYLDERFKQINLHILYFNGGIPTSDADAFINTMNAEENGLASKVGKTFNQKGVTLFNELAISKNTNLPENYEVVENDPTKLVVVYLPTYCVYSDGSQIYTRVFIMVPVYYAFTYASGVDEYVNGIKQYQIELIDGLLPSQPTTEE